MIYYVIEKPSGTKKKKIYFQTKSIKLKIVNLNQLKITQFYLDQSLIQIEEKPPFIMVFILNVNELMILSFRFRLKKNPHSKSNRLHDLRDSLAQTLTLFFDSSL
jgi:hypothetical protein